jgi:hypothetical protein
VKTWGELFLALSLMVPVAVGAVTISLYVSPYACRFFAQWD